MGIVMEHLLKRKTILFNIIVGKDRFIGTDMKQEEQTNL